MFSKYGYGFLESLLFFSPVWSSETALARCLKGKTVLITGASFGIGECLVEELAKTGAHLILVARTAEKLEQIKVETEKRGGKITIFPTDLTQTAEIEKLLAELRELPDGVDVFINNAGKSIRRSIYESLDRYHDFTRTMSLNYFAPVQLTLGLIPVLEKNQGHIINVSAVNVLLIPAPFWAAYQASKTAFDNWFRCVAPELNAAKIGATTVYLPLVRTRMIAPTQMYDKMPAMNPRHVAKIICGLIVSRKRVYAPWWLIFGQLASTVFRRPYDWFAPRLLKKRDDTVKHLVD